MEWLAYFTLTNLAFAQAITLLYSYLSGVYPSTVYAWMFILPYWFGHMGFLSLVSLAVTIPLTVISGGGHWARHCLAIFTAFVIVFLTIDTFVFAQYRFHINFIVIDLFINGRGQVISISTVDWLIIGAVLILLVGVEILLARKIFRHLTRLPRLRPFLLFYVSCFVLSQLAHAWADANYYTPVTRLANLMPLSAPLQAKTLFSKWGLVDPEEVKRRKQLKSDLANSDLNYPLAPLDCTEERPRYNFLWIIVDSLRADMLNPTVMPNVFEFARSGAVFTNHFSNSNSTRHGIFSLFYGIPGSYFDSALKNQVPPVLISELARRRYNFGVFANAILTKPEFDQTVFLPVKNLRKASKSETVWERDIEITDEAVLFLKNQPEGQPFFTFLFYDAPHGYSYPKGLKVPFPVSEGFSYASLSANSDPALMRSVYSNSVFFNDDQIRRVLETLKEKNLNDRTIVLITGDHGQEMNDNKKGYWGHNSNYSIFQTKVPLVVFWPGRKAEEFRELTTHFDISSTMMTDALGCSNPETYSSGSNLFNRIGREWFMMGREGDYAIRSGDLTTVVYPTGDYDIVDDSYTPQSSARLNGDVMKKALQEMRRFKK